VRRRTYTVNLWLTLGPGAVGNRVKHCNSCKRARISAMATARLIATTGTVIADRV
jgi:hypothetical protein